MLMLGSAVRAQDDESSIRRFTVGGALPARYLAQVATFGNPLLKSQTYNLMLPPDNPWLCEFPEAYVSMMDNSTIQARAQEEYPYPVALFISINRCSPEQKARVAAQIQQRVNSRLELLVVYSPDPRSLSLLELKPDNVSAPPDPSLNNLAVVHVPYRYAAGIDTRMRMAWSGSDPRFLIGDNELWSFPVQVSNWSSTDDDYTPPDDGRFDEDDDDGGSDIYWFRIILFGILIMSPCCRACYLWYASGGRFYFRRNENGRIVGLQYVPPSPAWLSNGRVPGGDQANGPNHRSTTLTEEEFNQLPEIEYKYIASHYDEDNEAEENVGSEEEVEKDIEVGSNDEDKSENVESECVPNEDTTNDENSVKDNQNDDSSDSKVAGNGPKESLPEVKSDVSVEFGEEGGESNALGTKPESDVLTEKMESGSPDETAGGLVDDSEATEKQSSDVAPVVETPLNALEAKDHTTNSNVDDENALADDMEKGVSDTEADEIATEDSSVETGEVHGELVCKSTMCSICIDDFEEGEKLILLPKCQHGFHKDCIHPWLTERQGCCPFCKRSVLGDSETDEEESGEESPGGGEENTEEDTPAAASGDNHEEESNPRVPQGQLGAQTEV